MVESAPFAVASATLCVVPTKKASGLLTAEQLGAIAEVSLENAAYLIGEARGLIATGAVARSYSLAVLAAEEFGKCQLAVGSVGREAEQADYWKEWWSVFYGHGPKLARAAEIAGMAKSRSPAIGASIIHFR
jgi:AbiV family abortive infection protein